MPVDNRRPPNSTLPEPQTQQQPPRTAPETSTTAGEGQRSGKRQVSFADKDVVTLYRPSKGMGGHELPVTQPAKPPAPATARADARPACARIKEQNGGQSILWPSGQRYKGAYDGFGAPHGEGTVRLADGREHVSAWFHGACVSVAGDTNWAKDVEVYMSPPTKRSTTPTPTGVRTTPAPTPNKAAEKTDAGPKPGGMLGRLRNLSKKDKT